MAQIGEVITEWPLSITVGAEDSRIIVCDNPDVEHINVALSACERSVEDSAIFVRIPVHKKFGPVIGHLVSRGYRFHRNEYLGGYAAWTVMYLWCGKGTDVVPPPTSSTVSAGVIVWHKDEHDLVWVHLVKEQDKMNLPTTEVPHDDSVVTSAASKLEGYYSLAVDVPSATFVGGWYQSGRSFTDRPLMFKRPHVDQHAACSFFVLAMEVKSVELQPRVEGTKSRMWFRADKLLEILESHKDDVPKLCRAASVSGTYDDEEWNFSLLALKWIARHCFGASSKVERTRSTDYFV